VKVRVSGPPALLTEELSARIKQRLGLALGRFGPRLAAVGVRLSQREGEVHCEIDVSLRPRVVHVEEASGDPGRAADHAIGRVEGPVARAVERLLEW